MAISLFLRCGDTFTQIALSRALRLASFWRDLHNCATAVIEGRRGWLKNRSLVSDKRTSVDAAPIRDSCPAAIFNRDAIQCLADGGGGEKTRRGDG